MCPTVFREKGCRFFFFSLEEMRMHVHVRSSEGEAKYWLEPTVELARNHRLSSVQLRYIEKLVREHEMSSSQPGKDISPIAVTDISPDGIWVLCNEEEHFLSFKQFPWFETATVKQVFNVVEENPEAYHWPDLDVDLGLETIRHPDRYPLQSSATS